MDSKLIRVPVLSKNSTVPIPDLQTDRQKSRLFPAMQYLAEKPAFMSAEVSSHTIEYLWSAPKKHFTVLR